MSLILMRYESIKNVSLFFVAQKSGLCTSEEPHYVSVFNGENSFPL